MLGATGATVAVGGPAIAKPGDMTSEIFVRRQTNQINEEHKMVSVDWDHTYAYATAAVVSTSAEMTSREKVQDDEIIVNLQGTNYTGDQLVRMLNDIQLELDRGGINNIRVTMGDI